MRLQKMNFLKNNGIGGVEAISMLASGNSVADAGINVSKRLLAKKFEKLLLVAADAYVAGYSSTNTALLGVAGMSAAAGATAWGGLKAWDLATKSTRSTQEEKANSSRAGMAASFAAFVVFAIVFVLVTTARRQNMFTALAGDNMVTDYAKFTAIPLALLFVGLRVSISSEKVGTRNVLLIASALSAAFFAVAKRFYLVFKLNGIERDVFSTIATVFDACKAGPCNHQHAGFIKVFGQINTVLQNNLKMVFGEVDYAEISRELSKAQFYDNISAFTG